MFDVGNTRRYSHRPPSATAPFTSHGASRYLQDENLGSWVRLVAYVGPRHPGRRSQMRAMSDQPPSAESCTVTPLAVVYQTVAAILHGLCSKRRHQILPSN